MLTRSEYNVFADLISIDLIYAICARCLFDERARACVCVYFYLLTIDIRVRAAFLCVTRVR